MQIRIEVVGESKEKTARGSSEDCFRWTKHITEREAYTGRTKKRRSWKSIIANTTQFVIISPFEREICECVPCADKNCPEWKAL